MACTKLPTPDDLRQRLTYCPKSGKLYWNKTGVEAFTYTGKRGYKVTSYKHDGRTTSLYAHRVAWAVFYGEWPTGQIDHINRDRTDNSIKNLREVTNRQNSLNSKKRATNKSGFVGVYKHTQTGAWTAQITVHGKTKYLGCFDNIEDAAKKRREAEKMYFHD